MKQPRTKNTRRVPWKSHRVDIYSVSRDSNSIMFWLQKSQPIYPQGLEHPIQLKLGCQARNHKLFIIDRQWLWKKPILLDSYSVCSSYWALHSIFQEISSKHILPPGRQMGPVTCPGQERPSWLWCCGTGGRCGCRGKQRWHRNSQRGKTPGVSVVEDLETGRGLEVSLPLSFPVTMDRCSAPLGLPVVPDV